MGAALTLGVTESWDPQISLFSDKGMEATGGACWAHPSPLCSPLSCLFPPHKAPIISAQDGWPQEKGPHLGAQKPPNLLCDSGQVASLLWALVLSS